MCSEHPMACSTPFLHKNIMYYSGKVEDCWMLSLLCLCSASQTLWCREMGKWEERGRGGVRGEGGQNGFKEDEQNQVNYNRIERNTIQNTVEFHGLSTQRSIENGQVKELVKLQRWYVQSILSYKTTQSTKTLWSLHLDLSRCPLLHKSLQPSVLWTYRVVIQPESSGCGLLRQVVIYSTCKLQWNVYYYLFFARVVLLMQVVFELKLS